MESNPCYFTADAAVKQQEVTAGRRPSFYWPARERSRLTVSPRPSSGQHSIPIMPYTCSQWYGHCTGGAWPYFPLMQGLRCTRQTLTFFSKATLLPFFCGHGSTRDDRQLCKVLVRGLLRKALGTEADEKKRVKLTPYRPLALCCQAIRAEQGVRSPLLRFIWKHWHRVFDDLTPHAGSIPPASGGQGGGGKNISVDIDDASDRPRFSYTMPWLETLCLGFLMGMAFIGIVQARRSTFLYVGPFVDACLWLALLCSLILLLGWTATMVGCTMMLIVKDQIFSSGLQGIEMRAQTFIIGGILLPSFVLWFQRTRSSWKESWFPMLLRSIWKGRRSYTKQVTTDLFKVSSPRTRNDGFSLSPMKPRAR